ncbi:hypothetical protein SAMN06265371_104151 [Lutibacter agarilyticus]|uniref:Uncharacterized protein n=1 Tax=Lutibacter agarilyticus TaxID=1109740 RepID=A0A238WXC1_9FLAO|nr:hypothetical protein [Lutibacter agarilyticus]SNR51073.1 hypothetical protein SAMN06265371_104151 [Lutibacter agarilyticus]
MTLPLNPNRAYRRLEIDLVFKALKVSMHKEACIRGNGVALYEDLYTGETLRGGDPYDYDHIRSAEEIFSKYKKCLTDKEIAAVVNCRENVGVTLSSINKSKGKKRMEEWLSNSSNIDTYNIDLKVTLLSLKRADNGIEMGVKQFSKVIK